MKLLEELYDLTPPHDLDAEKGVLGSVLIRPVVLDDVAGVLKPNQFYADANRKLYTHLLAMHGDRQPIDTLLLVQRLKAAGDLEAIGGPAYLAEVAQSSPVAAHAMHYAGIVREKSTQRALLESGWETIRQIHAGGDSQDVLAAAEKRLGRIETGDYTGDPKPIADSVLAAMERATAVMERTQKTGLLTGLEDFDTRLGGLFGGELFVLAARPGKGKTALACQIARHVASRGRLCYFASLEMSDVELTTRMLCSMADVNSKRIRTGQLTRQDMAALTGPSNELANSAMVIHDRPGLSVADIGRACRRLASKGLAMIVVDYLQRVTPADRRANRYEQVADICKGLKTLARELDVPVMCLAQLGRDADKTGKPELHHLRESGDIEAEADVIAFLLRTMRWEKADEVEPWKAAIVIEKNRNGETLTLRLRWDAARTRFDAPAAIDMPNYDPGLGQYGGDGGDF